MVGNHNYGGFIDLLAELMYSVIIQMKEALSTFYRKWMNIDTKQKLFRYLTKDLTGN